MSARLEAAAEVLKLERLLGLGDGELDFLAGIDAAELRTLRERVTDSLFDAGASSLTRLAAAAKLLPSGLVASVAERSFGPLLCARAAATVDPDKAIDVAKRLSSGFLADATIELDPRRVARIIAGVPTSLVEPVARELGERGEHVTMGRFLAFVPDHAIAAAMGALSDEAMLRTAFVLEHKDALDHAVGLLPPDRLPGVLRVASEQDLWAEALDLLDHLTQERRGPIAEVIASMEDDVVARLVGAASAADLWDALLPVVGVMSDEARLRLAARPAFHGPRILREIIEAAARDGALWPDLLPLVEALPDQERGTAADLIAAEDPAVVVGLIGAVQELGLWATLLPVVRTMSEDSRVRLATMGVFHDEAVIRSIVVAGAEEDCWVDLAPLLRVLPDQAMDTVLAVVTGLPHATLTTLLSQAVRAADTLRPLVDIFAELDDTGRARVIEVLDTADPALAEAVLQLREDPQLAELVDQVPADIMAAVDRAAAALGS